jgi:2-aminoethylphosphonate-pyruvate transaminase
MSSTVLFTPGPVRISKRVRVSLLGPDLPPDYGEGRTPADEVSAKLLKLFELDAADHAVAILPGTDAVARFRVLVSVVPPAGTLVVCATGSAAAEAAAQGRALGRRVREVPPELGAVAAALERAPDGVLWATLLDADTGVLAPIGALGRLAAARGARFVVDGTVGLGAEPLDFARSGAGCVLGSSHRGLAAVPGLAFAVVRRAWLEGGMDLPGLTLADAVRGAEVGRADCRQSRQPPCQLMLAMEAALDELSAEGLPQRLGRYASLTASVRDELEARGICRMRPPGHEPAAMSFVDLPEGTDPDRLCAWLDDQGFAVGWTSGRRRLQIATWGEIPPEAIKAFAHALHRGIG